MKKSVLIAIFLILLIIPVAFAFSLGNKEVFSLNKVFSDFFAKLTGRATTTGSCSDTDAGQDYSAKGTVTGTKDDGTAFSAKEDFCRDATTLKEFYCTLDAPGDINNWGSILKTCENGCLNGACVTSGQIGECTKTVSTCTAWSTCSSSSQFCIDTGCSIVTRTCTSGACTDSDNDGYGSSGSAGCAHTGVDCNDNNILINPGVSEACTNVNAVGVGIDDNCDNLINCQDITACPCSSSQVCNPTTHLCATGANQCASNLCVLGESSYKICEDLNGDGWKELATIPTDCPAGQTCSSSGICMAGDRTLPCESQTTSVHNYCLASDCSITNRLQSSDTTSNYVCCSVDCIHINSAPYFINITTIPGNTTNKEANLKIKAIVTLNDPNLGDRLNISYTWYEGGFYPWEYKINISNRTKKHSMPNATNIAASSTWIALNVPYNLTSYSIGYNYTLGVYACDGRLCNQTNSSKINITTTAGLPVCTAPDVLCTASLPSCPVGSQVPHSGSGICCSQACTASVTCTPACTGETPACDSSSGVCKCTSTSCGSGKTCNSAGACELISVSSTTAGCTAGTDRIVPVGTRTNVGTATNYSFCDIGYNWMVQRIADVSCQNDYECASNTCKGNKCLDVTKLIENIGFLKKIWCKITNPIDNSAYNVCLVN